MKCCIVILALLIALPGRVSAAPSPVTLVIKDNVTKFERFYRDASQPGVTESRRWILWQKEYGIAAVPPTPDGMKLARKQLDAVWPKYKSLIPKLPSLTAAAIADAQTTTQRIAEELDPQGRPVTIRLMLYVGQFDGNAFSMPAADGRPATTVMPVETTDLHLLLAHELSHAVHFTLAGVRNSFGAPLAETIYFEGIAMRSASRVAAGLPDTAYTEMADDHGWLDRCLANKRAVLQGAMPYLGASGPDVTTHFTFGAGTTGMRREAYCAAWVIFGTLLSHRTLAELATIPETEMAAVVRQGLTDSLATNQ